MDFQLQQRWRVFTLIVLLVASGAAVFAPGVGASQGTTNLQYGLQLAGGARVRAPIIGMTAEGINVTSSNQVAIETNVTNSLGLDRIDVDANPRSNTVEVFADINDSALRDALLAMGYEPSTIRRGVTESTRETMVAVLQERINELGLSGGSVSQARTAEGEYFIVVEVPGQNASQVEELIAERGVVKMLASFPAAGNESGHREVTVIRQGDIAGIGQVQTQRGQPVVPVTLTKPAAKDFSAAMIKYGFIQEATDGQYIFPALQTDCAYETNPNRSYCLLTSLNGEIVYSSMLASGLAEGMLDGTFNRTGEFVMTAGNISQARQLRINLQTGSLPASLNLSAGTTSYVTGTRASQYKITSFITALVAIVAVSLVVFLRYGRPEVAAPMVVTALSEVAILLGFAAAIQLPLDLSHIAGFIAVIGTGVDDLIIIADEVLTEEVKSNRVFKS
ncbi:MAG: preprotein translocase subunit SecD, partial [Halobacteriaceae archaeon]